ncbi:MAG: ATP-binding cassette domain-containing protein [Candidatus Korarchaeota archaeon]
MVLENVIEVNNLVKVYPGGTRAVDELSFSIKKGEIYGLLGPNGAGKTTTISILATILKPTSGEARIMGYDVVKESNMVRKCIGIVFQDFSLDQWLTVRENLDFHARIYGLSKKERKERIDYVLELVDMKSNENTLVRYLSGGMKRRVEIARGLIHYPKVLFLDEPTTGLDVQTRILIWDQIKKLNKEYEITILLTTHYMEEANKLCNRVLIMDHGKKMAEGAPEELKSNIGGDTIEIGGDATKITNVLQKNGFEPVSVADSKVTILVKNADAILPKIVGELLREGVELQSLHLSRASLDDVFLRLTGRRIRDSLLSGSDVMRAHAAMRERAMQRRWK